MVAAYDPQSRILTLQDGRMVRVQPGSVWEVASTDAIQPGRHVYARNAEPVGIQTGLAAQPGAWRIGTVDRIDLANGLLYLRDGAVVGVNAATPVTMNGQRVALSQIRPGAQIAVRMPDATGFGQDQVGRVEYAVPRTVTTPPASAQVLVFP
jgi:hypothetical protein